MQITQGRDVRIYVSSTGKKTGSKLEVEYQDDMTINTGRDVTTKKYKNGTSSTTTDSGYSFDFTMADVAPQTAAQLKIEEHHENKTQGYIWVIGKGLGARIIEGTVKIVIPTIATPTDGDSVVTVKIAQDGEFLFSKVTTAGSG